MTPIALIFLLLLQLSCEAFSFRHLVQRANALRFNRKSPNWGRLTLSGLVMAVSLALLPPTLSAQNTARMVDSDQGLPNAPGRGNSGDASSSQMTPSQMTPSESSASIAGTVLNTNGSAIPMARVTLSGPEGVVVQVVDSDVNGRFAFVDLAPGTYKMKIASAGFQAFVSAEIVIAAGEKRELPGTALPVARANTDMQVFAKQDEIAQAQVQLAEKQRVFGIIPNFYSSYIWDAAPLTPRLKFHLALRSTTDPVTFLLTGALAGVEQAHNTFPGYGGGPEGFGKRYGAAYADNVLGRLIGSAILPSVFHQDPRYFYKGSGTITSRALYAVGATVIARGDNGRSQPNYSHILGNFAAAAISNVYRSPADRSVTLTFRNGLAITGSNAVANLVREFLLRKITSKVPAYELGKP